MENHAIFTILFFNLQYMKYTLFLLALLSNVYSFDF